MKKVLSIVLSLAMILTSITVYNTTVKAEADVTESAEQESIDVDSIEDWIQIGTTTDGCKAYISKAATETMGNDGFRGFYEAGKSNNWGLSESSYMRNIPVFGFVTTGNNASNVIIDGIRYVNDSNNTKAYVGGDCVYINQNILKVPDGEKEHTFIITAEGAGTKTFALKVEALTDPTDPSSVDTSDWTECTARGANSKLVSGTYYMDKDSYTNKVNPAIWGTVGVATDNAYHNDATNCKIKGVAFTFAVTDAIGDSAAVWIGGKRYKNASEMVHLRANSVEISVAAFNEGINYIAIEGANKTVTYAIKYVPAEPEVAPDQTLDEVTDYVNVTDRNGTNNISVYGTRYSVSESFRNEKINYIDLFGLFAHHVEALYHPSACTINGAAYISSYPSVAGKIQSIWIDGVKYESGTADCFIDGDQVHLSENLFKLPEGTDEKVFAVTIRSKDTDLTYALKVTKVDTCKLTFDGEELLAAKDDKYALPKADTYGAKYGYLSNDGKMYTADTILNTVSEDINFTSVKNLNVSITNGMSIRLKEDENGLRFMAKVSSDNDSLIDSDAVEEGILIAPEDYYTDNLDDITLDKNNVVNVVNEKSSDGKWYNNLEGTYCASVINMIDSNIIRPFVARAYTTVKYYNGETATYYSNVVGKKSIQEIAALIRKTPRYLGETDNGYTDIEKGIIDNFANYGTNK